MLAFPPAVLAQPQSVGELLVGKAAFGNWRTDAPMVRRKITDLPAPYATRLSFEFSSGSRETDFCHAAGAAGIPGRAIRVQPPRSAHNSGCADGDISIAESEPGRIRVIRAADGVAKPSSNDVFASGLDQPFGIAFYPPGSDPQWIYVANTGSVVCFPSAAATQSARESRSDRARSSPCQGPLGAARSHYARIFSPRTANRCSTRSAASNPGRDGKRDAGAIVRREGRWAGERMGNRRTVRPCRDRSRWWKSAGVASGLRNCVWISPCTR